MALQNVTEPFEVVLFSFGFKYGAPTDVSMLVDIRFLPNPYWEEALRDRTGHDPEVAAYVLESDSGRELLDKLLPLARFLVGQHRQAQKGAFRIGIGCTGGHHRSVALVERLAVLLADQGSLTVFHRDVANE